jgi:hypothetical protein
MRKTLIGCAVLASLLVEARLILSGSETRMYLIKTLASLGNLSYALEYENIAYWRVW